MAVNPLSRPVSASELRYRVGYQVRTPAKDGATWGASTLYWANIEPLGAAALAALGLAGSAADFRFTLRPEVTPVAGNRFVYDSRNYRIDSVQQSPRGRTICLCTYVP